MRTKTLEIMASVERRLNTLIRLENRSCGIDTEIAKADRARDRLEKYLIVEIEGLCEKAGVP